MNLNKPLAHTLLATALMAALSGCSFQPHYQRPALPVADQWQQPADTTTGKAASDIAWNEFFRDSDMRQLISLALANNRDLKVAALNVESARAQYQITGADLMPSVGAELSKTAEHLPGGLYSTQSTGPVTYQQYQGDLAVSSWELDFWGRIRSLRDQSLEQYLADQSTQQATRISLIAEVAQAYITLSADSDLEKVAQQTAASQTKSLSIANARYRAGSASQQDVLQAETTVKSAEADVQMYQRQKQQALNALALLVGTRLPAGIAQHATLQKSWFFPPLNAGLPSQVLTRRPDIIAAEHTLKAANANIGAARAAFFPTISLTASGGSMSGGLSQLFDGGTGAWSFVPSINLPIFEGGRNRAQLDVAKISKRIDIANYEKAIQQAFKEVSDALIGEQTYQREIVSRHDDLTVNQKYYQLAQLRYQTGVDDYLQVLTAQRSLYSAQQTYISVLASSLNQQVTLYKVLGGGWQ